MIKESKNYSVLYHYIPIYNLKLAIEEYKRRGKLYLKTDVQSDRTDNYPVISLSRNPSMNTRDLLLSKQLCRITLDANKLSQRYRLKPYADSTYTPGSDGEQEEMMLIPRNSYVPGSLRNVSTQIPSKYGVDILDYILRIDILTKPHEMKDVQGYASWSKKHDDYNPKYIGKFFDDRKAIEEDHSIQIQDLFKVIKDTKFDFPIKVVSKFTNIKYQDRYISSWTRNGFRINNFKKFEAKLNESNETYNKLINTLESFLKYPNEFTKFNKKVTKGRYKIDLSFYHIDNAYLNFFKKKDRNWSIQITQEYRDGNETYYEIDIYNLQDDQISKLYEIVMDVSGIKNAYKKMNEDRNIEIGNSSDYSNDGWKENTIHISTEDFFNRWYKDKKHIRTEGNYDVYLYHHKNYSEKDEEYFWETKKILKVEKRDDDVTHYFEKELISKPLYKPRMEGMTIEQENRVRAWCGTKKNPKPHMGEFIGYEKGLAIMRSFLSDKINGKKYHILPDGNIVEMFRPNDDHINKEDDDIDKEYVQKNIDYLLDTKNFDLIHYIEGYMN